VAVASTQSAELHTSRVQRADEPDLSFEDHLEIMDQHLQLLNKRNKFRQALEEIRADTSQTIVHRWNAASAIFAVSLAHCLSPYGFTPGDMGSMVKYQEQQDAMVRKHEHGTDIRKFNRERLLVLVETAFGMQLPEESDVDLKMVRKALGMLAMRTDSDEFVEGVQKELANVPGSGSEADAMKFQLVQLAILSLHAEIAESFDLPGDEGFIKLQVAIMENQTDDQVRYSASMAYLTIFNKVGLKIPDMSQG